MTRPLPEPAVGLLDRFADDVQEIVCRLRERVLAVTPNASEIVTDVGYTVPLQYGPDDKVGHAFCYIAGFSKHANLGFQRGSRLPDPESVMEGTGAHMRHIKFATVAQTSAPWVDDYLEAALAFRGLDSRIGDGQSRIRLKPARSGAGRVNLALRARRHRSPGPPQGHRGRRQPASSRRSMAIE